MKKLKEIVTSIITESPLTALGNNFLSKKIDMNQMHTHTYSIHWNQNNTNSRSNATFIGGVSTKEDAIKYAKAYYATHKFENPKSVVYIVRSIDNKMIFVYGGNKKLGDYNK